MIAFHFTQFYSCKKTPTGGVSVTSLETQDGTRIRYLQGIFLKLVFCTIELWHGLPRLTGV